MAAMTQRMKISAGSMAWAELCASSRGCAPNPDKAGRPSMMMRRARERVVCDQPNERVKPSRQRRTTTATTRGTQLKSPRPAAPLLHERPHLAVPHASAREISASPRCFEPATGPNEREVYGRVLDYAREVVKGFTNVGELPERVLSGASVAAPPASPGDWRTRAEGDAGVGPTGVCAARSDTFRSTGRGGIARTCQLSCPRGASRAISKVARVLTSSSAPRSSRPSLARRSPARWRSPASLCCWRRRLRGRSSAARQVEGMSPRRNRCRPRLRTE